jgi:DNA-binding IclR family transcriptional regulator
MVEQRTREQRSKDLFGNQHMLSACEWISAADGGFCSADIVSQTAIPSTSVQRILSTLVGCSLVRRLPRARTERTQWYEREASAFWLAATELASGTHELSEVGR